MLLDKFLLQSWYLYFFPLQVYHVSLLKHDFQLVAIQRLSFVLIFMGDGHKSLESCFLMPVQGLVFSVHVKWSPQPALFVSLQKSWGRTVEEFLSLTVTEAFYLFKTLVSAGSCKQVDFLHCFPPVCPLSFTSGEDWYGRCKFVCLSGEKACEYLSYFWWLEASHLLNNWDGYGHVLALCLYSNYPV